MYRVKPLAPPHPVQRLCDCVKSCQGREARYRAETLTAMPSLPFHCPRSVRLAREWRSLGMQWHVSFSFFQMLSQVNCKQFLTHNQDLGILWSHDGCKDSLWGSLTSVWHPCQSQVGKVDRSMRDAPIMYHLNGTAKWLAYFYFYIWGFACMCVYMYVFMYLCIMHITIYILCTHVCESMLCAHIYICTTYLQSMCVYVYVCMDTTCMQCMHVCMDVCIHTCVPHACSSCIMCVCMYT